MSPGRNTQSNDLDTTEIRNELEVLNERSDAEGGGDDSSDYETIYEDSDTEDIQEEVIPTLNNHGQKTLRVVIQRSKKKDGGVIEAPSYTEKDGGVIESPLDTDRHTTITEKPPMTGQQLATYQAAMKQPRIH